MIIKNGKNIASGWWYPYSSKTPHIMHSLSKSFTSTAIGFAIDEGILNLNDRVVSFFPELKNHINDVNFKEMKSIKFQIFFNLFSRKDYCQNRKTIFGHFWSFMPNLGQLWPK